MKLWLLPCLFLSFFAVTLHAQTEGLEWLYSRPVSVSPIEQETIYQLKLKLRRESHIRTLRATMEGDEKYVVSKSMAYTDPTGFTEVFLKVKFPDQPIRIWVVDELTGTAKAFLWQPGTNINVPESILAQPQSTYVAGHSSMTWDNADPRWKDFDRSFSLALNLGPVGYTTEIETTSTALDFDLKVAPRGTMEYWQDIKDSNWFLQLKGSLQQVAINEGDVFAPPSSDSNLLYSGETNGWYQLANKYYLNIGLKYQREVFLARELDGATTVAALQEQDLGKLRLGGGIDLWSFCQYCRSRVSAGFDTLLFSSGDREFEDYLGFEISYDVYWRWKEKWQLQGGLGYKFQNYSFKAVDEVTSLNLSAESQTSELSLGFGAAYLF